jgi:VanZ family protein
MPIGQRQIWLYRVLLVALFVMISYLAFTPLKFPIIERVWDKLNHFAAFFALALVTDFAFPNRGYGMGKILPLLGYGLLIEIIQHHLPYRQFDLLDVCADGVGLLLYGVSLPLVRRLPVLSRRWS